MAIQEEVSAISQKLRNLEILSKRNEAGIDGLFRSCIDLSNELERINKRLATIEAIVSHLSERISKLEKKNEKNSEPED